MATARAFRRASAGRHPGGRFAGGMAAGVAMYPVVLLLAFSAALSFASGGYILKVTAPIVFLAVVGLIGASWLAREAILTPRIIVALGLLAVSTFWVGLSVVWSLGPDLSWTSFDAAFLYFVVLALAILTPAGPRQIRLLGGGYLVMAVVVSVYAFLGKALPEVVTHAHAYARLDQPIGYWNVLALMMVMAIPLGLELASRRRHALWARAAGSAALCGVGLAFFFTFSRGGYVVLLVVLLVYFVLASERLSSLFSLFAAALPVAAVLLHLRGSATLFNATTNDALRTAQGHALGRWSLAAVALAVVVQLGGGVLHRRLHVRPAWVRIAGLAVVVCLVVVTAVGLQVAFATQGGVLHWLSQRYHATVTGAVETGNDSSRLFSFDTGRLPLWREGIEQAREHVWTGTGAGTFRFTHLRYRTGGGIVVHAHSEWINALSDTGIVGLALFAAAIVALLACTLRRLRRDRGDPQRALVAAFQAACVAFVVHLSWDWTWDMAAVTVVFLMMAGTVSSYLAGRSRDESQALVAGGDAEGGAAEASDLESAAAESDVVEASDSESAAAESAAAEPPDAGTRPELAGRHWVPALPVRALASGILVVLAVSWLLPYLGDRAEFQAVTAVGKGDLRAAAAAARRAARFDPLAVGPLVTLSLVQQQQGQVTGALATLQRAERLQPQDYAVHYQMGLLLLGAFARLSEAQHEFRVAAGLNPHDAHVIAALQSSAQR